MVRVLYGIFLVLHGIVHLLYFGHSARYFELKPGMVWPDGAWAFSRVLNEVAVRNLTSVLMILSALGFAAGGLGVFGGQSWYRPVVIGVTVFSSLVFILLWDGSFNNLDGKGGVGILINLAILAALLIFHWPKFEF